MKWIWQDKNWPNFIYDTSDLTKFESEFQQNVGIIIGIQKHLESENTEKTKIEILTQEALSTSSIEGEILQRDSVQSSIRKHFGLKTDFKKIPANAAGIAEMMVDVYSNYSQKLSHDTFFEWHKMLMNGRRDLEIIGDYRKHDEPMQIVSGNLAAPKVFYEAPPSKNVQQEMARFIDWYNQHTDNSQSVLVFAGIAHLMFEIIHPFEDGNGRIGRVLVEKAISQKLNRPALNLFSKVIETNKKAYYEALQSSNHGLDINKWLIFFSKMILESQLRSIQMIDFLVSKSKFFSKHNRLNDRQLKVLLRIFEEGIEGFKGGLSASNYRTISLASAATVTRDLQDLVSMNALTKTGELKHTRYFLNLKHNKID